MYSVYTLNSPLCVQCTLTVYVQCVHSAPLLPGLPDPPVKVELCDWDVDHMDLQWMFPPSDGGAPILLYKVQYNGTAQQCPVPSTTHKLHKL